MLGPGGLTRQTSTFTRREVIQQLAEAHPGGAPPGHLERLADEFLARTCVALDARRRRHDAATGTRSTPPPTCCAPRCACIDAATGRDPHGPLVADARALDA